jgi:hypothetical protein
MDRSVGGWGRRSKYRRPRHLQISYAIVLRMLSFSYALQHMLTGKWRPRLAARPQGIPVMSLLTHHFERAFDPSDRQPPIVRWATIKRVCARALGVLTMVGVLAGLIALKTYIFLPRIMN